MLIRLVNFTNDLCATSAGLTEAKRGQQRDKGIGRKPKGENTMKEKKTESNPAGIFIMNSKIDRFHMTSRRPYWCSKQIIWELDSFLIEKVFFVPINLGLSIRAFRETGPWSVAVLSGIVFSCV